MAILSQLGINETTFYCFLIFLLTFFFLKELLFRPYFAAYEEREKRTKGGESTAKELQAQTLLTRQNFEEQAREINAEIKKIFDESRAKANKESERIVTEARIAAEQALEEARSRLALDIKRAQEQLSLEIPGVALAITKKMLD